MAFVCHGFHAVVLRLASQHQDRELESFAMLSCLVRVLRFGSVPELEVPLIEGGIEVADLENALIVLVPAEYLITKQLLGGAVVVFLG